MYNIHVEDCLALSVSNAWIFCIIRDFDWLNHQLFCTSIKKNCHQLDKRFQTFTIETNERKSIYKYTMQYCKHPLNYLNTISDQSTWHLSLKLKSSFHQYFHRHSDIVHVHNMTLAITITPLYWLFLSVRS